MYPPKVVNSAEEAVGNLWLSLQRGGDHWCEEAGISDDGDGSTVFVLRLRYPLPEKAKDDLRRFIGEYMQRSGWPSIVGVRKNYVNVRVRNA
jgi:hypothetical protein